MASVQVTIYQKNSSKHTIISDNGDHVDVEAVRANIITAIKNNDIFEIVTGNDHVIIKSSDVAMVLVTAKGGFDNTTKEPDSTELGSYEEELVIEDS